MALLTSISGLLTSTAIISIIIIISIITTILMMMMIHHNFIMWSGLKLSLQHNYHHCLTITFWFSHHNHQYRIIAMVCQFAKILPQ